MMSLPRGGRPPRTAASPSGSRVQGLSLNSRFLGRDPHLHTGLRCRLLGASQRSWAAVTEPRAPGPQRPSGPDLGSRAGL